MALGLQVSGQALEFLPAVAFPRVEQNDRDGVFALGAGEKRAADDQTIAGGPVHGLGLRQGRGLLPGRRTGLGRLRLLSQGQAGQAEGQKGRDRQDPS